MCVCGRQLGPLQPLHNRYRGLTSPLTSGPRRKKSSIRVRSAGVSLAKDRQRSHLPKLRRAISLWRREKRARPRRMPSVGEQFSGFSWPARQQLPQFSQHRPLLQDHLLVLRGGSSDQSVQAYEWTVNIATPATLVAGAALATLLEAGLTEGLALSADDPHWMRTSKKACLLLLVLACTCTGFQPALLPPTEPHVG